MFEYYGIMNGECSLWYVEGYKVWFDNYLLLFFGNKLLSEVILGLMQEYCVMCLKFNVVIGKILLWSMFYYEIVILWQVMKFVICYGWIFYLLDFFMLYKMFGKVSYWVWFLLEEYKMFYIYICFKLKFVQGKFWQYFVEQLYDFILFMVNIGLWFDEVNCFEYCDVSVEMDEDSGEEIFVIEVCGKCGVGYCKSINGVVFFLSVWLSVINLS